MTDKITTDQLDEIEAAAKKATPGPWRVEEGIGIDAGEYDEVISPGQVSCMSYCYGGSSTIDGDNLDADMAHIAMMDPATTLALVARVKDLEAQAEGATQQPVIDTLYGEGASGDLWRTALGLERTYAGFCETGDHYCLQSVGHYCQGGQQFIEAIEEEEA